MSPATLRPGDVVRIRDQRWRVTRLVWHGESSVLDVDGWDPDNRGLAARFLLPAERIDRLDTSLEPRVVRPARWRRLARRALGRATPRIDALQTAAESDIAVIPFQLEPALAVTRGLGCRLLIADEVGLGKTVQAGLVIAEVLHRTPDGRALVVSPASLVPQWTQELERFGLRAAALDATALARMALSGAPGANPWAAQPVVITSIDYVKRPEIIGSLEPLVWDVAVFDEAHALAGASDRAAATQGLARRARLVVLLSATPHSGDEAAFGRLCSIGRLPGDPPLLLFRRTRADAGLTSSRRTTWLRVRMRDVEIDMHRTLLRYARLVWSREGAAAGGARLAMSVLVKRACSGATALARSVERRLLWLPASGETPAAQPALPFEVGGDDAEPAETLAAPGLDDRTEERRLLETIRLLARLAAARESKVRVLLRLIGRSHEPALVFTEYRDTLAHLAATLPAPAVELHGGLTRSERRNALRAFTEGRVRVLLATDAASEGLNLHQRCRLVVNMELPWTPLRLEQRVGRVDRIGQRARVHALHLVAGDTAEEHTVARLLVRAARARRAMHRSPAPLVDEHAVARAVLSVAPPDAEDAGADNEADRRAPAPGLELPVLGEAARAEAERLTVARRLLDRADGLDDPGRAALTVLRRRRPVRPVRYYWAFNVPILDASGQPLWSALVAIETLHAHAPPRGDRALRLALAGAAPPVQRAARLAQGEILRAAAPSLERRAALALGREHAIAEDLRRHRARLASLQPGLFDRRAERERAAQHAVLDEALERCRSRLRSLGQLGTPAPGGHDLVFVAIVE